MRYCEAVIGGGQGNITTQFFCDWNSQFYSSASDCVSQCSALLISKSEAQFIILFVFALFVLFLILALFKAVLE